MLYYNAKSKNEEYKEESNTRSDSARKVNPCLFCLLFIYPFQSLLEIVIHLIFWRHLRRCIQDTDVGYDEAYVLFFLILPCFDSQDAHFITSFL